MKIYQNFTRIWLVLSENYLLIHNCLVPPVLTYPTFYLSALLSGEFSNSSLKLLSNIDQEPQKLCFLETLICLLKVYSRALGTKTILYRNKWPHHLICRSLFWVTVYSTGSCSISLIICLNFSSFVIFLIIQLISWQNVPLCFKVPRHAVIIPTYSR